jgi:hypothetical protein
MVDPKTYKQLKPQSQAAPKSIPAKTAPTSDASRLQDKIRTRAHELYIVRARGNEQQDWLQAERETLKRTS